MDGVGIIFERSSAGHRGYRVPGAQNRELLGSWEENLARRVPAALLRKERPLLPEVTEPEVARHYVRLSVLNHHVDRDFYPLGSCTMKYNPKINEELVRDPRVAMVHPDAPSDLVQGLLRALWELEKDLARLVGLDAVSLQPAAGAQGELLGMKIVRKYHVLRGNEGKVRVLIPDSAHGTNPASVALTGLQPLEVPSGPDGRLDLKALEGAIDERTAALMITNPNTLGIFESDVARVAAMIHEVDGLVYMDGANLNALMGVAKPGRMGVDILHMNLHKTFSSPHGGGGPGSGPVAVVEKLAPLLPVPLIGRDGDRFFLDWDRPDSVGKLHPALGNVGVALRALAYIRYMGAEGLTEATRAAILNANYLLEKVKRHFPVPRGSRCMHEFVASAAWTREYGVTNIDVAKRLLDFGFHAPTVSFPLIVKDALMIEPTETETRQTLERFADALAAIAREVREEPERVKSAPSSTPVGRLDEASAARRLKVRWHADDGGA